MKKKFQQNIEGFITLRHSIEICLTWNKGKSNTIKKVF